MERRYVVEVEKSREQFVLSYDQVLQFLECREFTDYLPGEMIVALGGIEKEVEISEESL